MEVGKLIFPTTQLPLDELVFVSWRVSLNIGISGDFLQNFVKDATGTENWTSSHKVTMFIVESSKEELHLHPISNQTNEAKARPPEPVTRIESRVASNFL